MSSWCCRTDLTIGTPIQDTHCGQSVVDRLIRRIQDAQSTDSERPKHSTRISYFVGAFFSLCVQQANWETSVVQTQMWKRRRCTHWTLNLKRWLTRPLVTLSIILFLVVTAFWCPFANSSSSQARTCCGWQRSDNIGSNSGALHVTSFLWDWWFWTLVSIQDTFDSKIHGKVPAILLQLLVKKGGLLPGIIPNITFTFLQTRNKAGQVREADAALWWYMWCFSRLPETLRVVRFTRVFRLT